MGAERHDRPGDGEPDEHHTVADAYAPPAREHSRAVFLGVIALVAVCVVVFAVALAMR